MTADPSGSASSDPSASRPLLVSLPFVSVGVITRNEAATIVETLQSLMRQEYAPDSFEVIVVDGNSDDGTYALAKSFEEAVPDRVRVISESGPTSHGQARNLVLRHARTYARYFAFTDGDCRVPPNWLQVLIETLESASPDVAGCGGPRSAHSNDTGVALALGHYLANPLATGFNPGFASRQVKYTRGPGNYNAAYRGDILKAFTYDTNIRIGEDLDLNYRIRRTGLHFLQVSIPVEHHGAGSLAELQRQMFGYGCAKARFFMRHHRFDRFTSVAAPAFVLSVAVLLPIVFLFPATTGAVALVCAAYVCTVAYVTASVTRRMRSMWGLFCFPAMIITHFSYGTGFLLEFARQVFAFRRTR